MTIVIMMLMMIMFEMMSTIMILMLMMMLMMTSGLTPFFGLSLSFSWALLCLSRCRWWRTIRLQKIIMINYDVGLLIIIL